MPLDDEMKKFAEQRRLSQQEGLLAREEEKRNKEKEENNIRSQAKNDDKLAKNKVVPLLRRISKELNLSGRVEISRTDIDTYMNGSLKITPASCRLIWDETGNRHSRTSTYARDEVNIIISNGIIYIDSQKTDGIKTVSLRWEETLFKKVAERIMSGNTRQWSEPVDL